MQEYFNLLHRRLEGVEESSVVSYTAVDEGTLRAAFEATANATDVANVDISSNFFLSSNTIQLTSTLELKVGLMTIKSESCSLVGSGTHRIFVVNAGATLELRGLTVMNGAVAEDDDSGGDGGCALLHGSATLKTHSTTFKGCTASSNGGAIAALALTSVVNLEDGSQISDCTATEGGGFVHIIIKIIVISCIY